MSNWGCPSTRQQRARVASRPARYLEERQSRLGTWEPQDRLGEAYQRLNAWLEEHNSEAGGPPWEVYWWIDPSQEPDPSAWPAPAEWRTELAQPIASKEET